MQGNSSAAFPLLHLLENFHSGDTRRHAKLLHYGDDPVATDLTGWFHQFNGRQTTEARIKENKGVFPMRHLKLRSAAGLALAETFAFLPSI